MTAFEAPLIVYGSRNALRSRCGSNNPNKAPSMFGQGVGLLDDRAGYNTAPVGRSGVWRRHLHRPLTRRRRR